MFKLEDESGPYRGEDRDEGGFPASSMNQRGVALTEHNNWKPKSQKPRERLRKTDPERVCERDGK